VDGEGEGERGGMEDRLLAKAWIAQDFDLAQLWVAGDRLLIRGLQNDVMWAYHQLWSDELTRRTCSTRMMRYVYQHTCVGSPLRGMLVDQVAYTMGFENIKAHQSDLPREMLVDLVLTYSTAIAGVEGPYDRPLLPKKSLPKEGPTMEHRKWQYSRTRTWRNHLVPED
jgi:hypothetical protein